MGFAVGALAAKLQAGELHEVLRLADRIVTLADGDASMGSGVMGSPLAVGFAFRGIGRWSLGLPGWRDDFEDSLRHRTKLGCSHSFSGDVLRIRQLRCPWILPADATALRDTEETLERAQRSGDDLGTWTSLGALEAPCWSSQMVREREIGLALLAEAREDVEGDRFSYAMLGFMDVLAATAKAAVGDLDAAS